MVSSEAFWDSKISIGVVDDKVSVYTDGISKYPIYFHVTQKLTN